MIRKVAAVVLVGAIVVGIAPGAAAQEPDAPVVTLEASAAEVRWNTEVKLSGSLSSGEEGAEIAIVDEGGRPVAEAVTGPGGRYKTSFVAVRNVTLRARWTEVESEPVDVGVKPLVEAALYHVRLFGRALVLGRMRPGVDGARVTVKLRRAGRVVRTKRVRTADGRFRARFGITRPGRYSVRAAVAAGDLEPAGATTTRRRTPLPSLSIGDRNIHVKLLEGRLRDLGYYLPKANRKFDEKTRDALLAFAKVQRVARTAAVDEGTWRRLASPVKPRPRAKSRFHIEIDQTRQVIFVVKSSKVRWIVHTSTGKASTPTRDGVWRVHRKVAGYSPGRLYYPSYFDGLRAIHGWPEVPTYPASHGCARVPMWAAQWMYGLADIGTVVRVYH